MPRSKNKVLAPVATTAEKQQLLLDFCWDAVHSIMGDVANTKPGRKIWALGRINHILDGRLGDLWAADLGLPPPGGVSPGAGASQTRVRMSPEGKEFLLELRTVMGEVKHSKGVTDGTDGRSRRARALKERKNGFAEDVLESVGTGLGGDEDSNGGESAPVIGETDEEMEVQPEDS